VMILMRACKRIRVLCRKGEPVVRRGRKAYGPREFSPFRKSAAFTACELGPGYDERRPAPQIIRPRYRAGEDTRDTRRAAQEQQKAEGW
jgi:hypothetical protein